MVHRRRSLVDQPESRFPVRICLETPPNGFGQQLNAMYAWLDTNCGADCWASSPAGLRGVVNDALAIYFLDPTLAAAFVHRWCIGYRIETAKGTFRMREDEPTPRVGLPRH